MKYFTALTLALAQLIGSSVTASGTNFLIERGAAGEAVGPVTPPALVPLVINIPAGSNGTTITSNGVSTFFINAPGLYQFSYTLGILGSSDKTRISSRINITDPSHNTLTVLGTLANLTLDTSDIGTLNGSGIYEVVAVPSTVQVVITSANAAFHVTNGSISIEKVD